MVARFYLPCLVLDIGACFFVLIFKKSYFADHVIINISNETLLFLLFFVTVVLFHFVFFDANAIRFH